MSNITIKELRIGNFVNYKDLPHRYEIRSISNHRLHPINLTEHDDTNNTGYAIDCELEDIKPIKLTGKLLIKVGLEKLPGSENVYRIISDDLEISVNTKLHFGYIDTPWGQASIKHPRFKYLHQLQNLYYSLTGKELPI